MEAELRGREHRVPVCAEAVERDVAEVEQAGVAHGDVQPKREQHVQQRVEADLDDVAVRRHHRDEPGCDCEREIERGWRHAFELALDQAGEPAALHVALLVGRDPFVDADAWSVRILRHQ